jgi:2-polyprenyl-6-methoxyphenol hydroxylase-like FAD-dependent oxidoreductase
MANHLRRDQIPVAIVGAGPVGLALALGLARHGVRSVVIERNSSTNEQSRAPVLHVRTMEVLQQWEVRDRFLEAGVLRRSITLHSPDPGRQPLAALDFAELDAEADDPGLLILEQARTESILLEAVRESGLCEVRFGAEAVELEQRAGGARVTFREAGESRTLEASFVAGCDGAGSFVRRALGFSFDGHTYSTRPMLADVRIDDGRDRLPWPRTSNGRGGITTAIRLGSGLWRLIRIEPGDTAKADDHVPEDEVGERVDETLGAGPFTVVWASRFRIHRRSSPRFRSGRVLLAGDAAHVHSPVGGLGMNGGIQDAHNLAWKLAGALLGGDQDRLLDSYDVERRAVAAERVSRYTDLVTRLFLQAPSGFRSLAFLVFRSVLRLPPLRRMQLRQMTMIDLGYADSPLLVRAEPSAGVRLPNVVLHGPDGSTLRLYDLLPVGPAIVAVGDNLHLPQDTPVDRVIRIARDGFSEPAGMLRGLLGGKDGWILVRPDAHVAWARHHPDGIEAAIRHALAIPA